MPGAEIDAFHAHLPRPRVVRARDDEVERGRDVQLDVVHVVHRGGDADA